MVSSSFASVTARTFHPQETPVLVRQVWSNIVKISLRLDEVEKIRRDLKSDYEILKWSLTEIQNAPPKNLSEEKGQHILDMQSEWENEMDDISQDLKELDRKITYFSDVNEDLQLQFREATSRILEKVDASSREKTEKILEQLKSESVDLKKMIYPIFDNPELQELYFNAADPSQAQSLTQKFKQFFKKGGKNE